MFEGSSQESGRPCTTGSSKWDAFLSRIRSLAAGHRQRRLRLCETLSLGEKRFVAVVEYGAQKFLLAGTPQNISLLQRLDESSGETEKARLPQSDPE